MSWGSFPTFWLKEKEVLPRLEARAQETGKHIAALKIYLAVALSVDFHTRKAMMTNDELVAITNLSRPMLKPALTVLEEYGLIRIERGYRHTYVQTTPPHVQSEGRTGYHWKIVPDGTIKKALRELPNRGVSVLAALKIYIVLLYVTDVMRTARMSHETMCSYTGVQSNKIRAGLDHLVNHGLIHINTDDDPRRSGRPLNVYTMKGNFDRRPMPTPTNFQDGSTQGPLAGEATAPVFTEILKSKVDQILKGQETPPAPWGRQDKFEVPF